MKTKTAVILFNLGGPSSEKDIFSFLFSFFSDPAILPFPQPFRSILAGIIALFRLKKAREIYRPLGGGSPLLHNTEIQAKALQKELGADYKVLVCMRHAAPRIESVWETIKKRSLKEIVLLPLFPQYSTTTTESFFQAWRENTTNLDVPVRFIPEYPTLDGFVDAQIAKTIPYYNEAQKYGNPKILLTAHGLPEKVIEKGDPYQQQVLETAEKFKEKTGFQDATVCYQSRVGWLPWIRPFLEESIEAAAREGRPLVVVPLSFVSEHSETLVELDILMRDLAKSLGSPYYGRVPTVQTHPMFIKGLASLVKE